MSKRWENGTGLAKIWVQSADERGRQFTFEIAAKHSKGKLVALSIADTRISVLSDPSNPSVPLTETITAELAQFGIAEIETGNQTIRARQP